MSIFEGQARVRLYIPVHGRNWTIDQLSLVISHNNKFVDCDGFHNNTWWDIHPLKNGQPAKGYKLSSKGLYIAKNQKEIHQRGDAQALTTNAADAAVFVVTNADEATTKYTLTELGTENALGVDTRGMKGLVEPLHDKNAAPYYQHFTWGGQLQPVTITEELSIKQAKNYDLVWWDKGSRGDNNGSFWRAKLPDGYFAIGHFGTSGYDAPQLPMVVVKPVEGCANAIAHPTDYTKIWDDKGSGADENGSFWLPTPPADYVACGVVATGSHSKPSFDEVVCIRQDLVEPGVNGPAIWLDNGTRADVDVGTWCIKPKNGQGVDANTFYAVASHDAPANNPAWHCLASNRVSAPDPLSKAELNDAIQKYAPMLHLHPDEQYKATSVEYFVKNAQVLEKASGKKTQANIDALPQGQGKASKFQLIMKNNSARGGNFNQAKCYIHAKAQSSQYTDIQCWFFYAYNGHGTFRLKTLAFGQTLWAGNTSAEPVGEHEGDWEHVTVRISNFTHKPVSTYLSQHGGGQWVPWDQLSFTGTQPNVYASLNGHATYTGVGSNYSNHIKIPDTDWSPQGIEFFLVNETKAGGAVLNCAAKHLIMNADYLGKKAPAQPSWVNYWGRWGKSSGTSFSVSQVAAIILKNAPQLLITLGPLATSLVAALAPLIVPFINVEDQDGPTAPIAKGGWDGVET